ncbi:MAG: pyridoxal-dependent decarboxylase [Chloroflexi bacterium]|nr:pyridoxal-dependent decarboxylase [Chloroflexota bacterium]
MHMRLKQDQENIEQLLQTAVSTATDFIRTLAERPAAIYPAEQEPDSLPEEGLGAAGALAAFQAKYGDGLSGSAGARYFGFVTGGSTPAALVGDWLTAVYDQNPIADEDSIAPKVEAEAIRLLRQLFSLPDEFIGTFVSGATVANFVGLAQGRQWLGLKHGRNVAQDGLIGLPQLPVLAATPHSSSYKALAMLGMGKANLIKVDALPEREAMDIDALTAQLAALNGQPAMVVASSGTVNTVDFDDLAAVAHLKQTYDFWLHVDAAFGGFAACSPRYAHLLAGLAAADSITIDAHKWLNVPYDSAMTFSRHPKLQVAVFENTAVYLGPMTENPSLVHWTPQNSRRFRALPAWMTLMAYGRSGYQEIVERNCDQAAWLGEQIDQSRHFRLLAPVNMNVVCFTLAGEPTIVDIQRILAWLRDDGRVYLTPTQYGGVPGIRVAISNWQTAQTDVEICWQALRESMA